jgi:hypothetical protein
MAPHSRIVIFTNFIFVAFVSLIVFWAKPQFEENAHLIKLIMYDCNGLMKDFYHFNDLIFWQTVLQKLYSVSYTVPWFPVFVIVLSSFSIVFILNLILKVGSKKSIPASVTLFLVFFLFFLLLNNLYWVEYDRVAFIVSGSAVIFFIVIPDLFSQQKSQILVYTIATIWYIGGVCLRPEIGIVTFVALSPTICLLFYPRITYCAKVFLPVFVVILCFTLAYGYNLMFSEEYYYKTEPDIEYELLDRANIVPLSKMTTKEDSMRYIAVTQQWMLGDLNNTPVEFIRQLLNKDNTWYNRVFFFLQPVEGRDRSILHLGKWFDMIKVKSIYSVYIFILFMLIYYVNGVGLALLTALSFFVLSFFISLSFSINSFDRIIEPLMGLGCVVHTLVLFKGNGLYKLHKLNKLISLFSVAAVVVLLACKLLEFKAKTDELSVEQRSVKEKIQRACSSNNRKYVVIFLDQVCLNTGDALQVFDVFNNKTLILSDFAQFSANSNFLATTQERTGCKGTDFLCRMKFIQDHASESVVIATKDRLNFFTDYMGALYGYKFNVVSSNNIWLSHTTYIWLPEK